MSNAVQDISRDMPRDILESHPGTRPATTELTRIVKYLKRYAFLGHSKRVTIATDILDLLNYEETNVSTYPED